jgi:DNA-binding MarR family transcriptional regulator
LEEIGKLEKKSGLLRLLVFLYDHGEYMLSDIWDDSGISRNSGAGAIELLKKYGLVKNRVDDSKYPPRYLYSLTDNGKNVAQKLKEIEEILNGSGA